MRVMATPNGGAFAEYVAVHPGRLQLVPDQVPLEVMLAYPVNMRTAYYMVYVWAKVQEGDRVLLHAAAGGVGLLTLQILKRRFKDVPVVAIASTEEKLRLLEAEGADHVINRKTQDYVEEVLKIWGPEGLRLRHRRCSRPGASMWPSTASRATRSARTGRSSASAVAG